MTEPADDPAVRAAMRLWESLAALAWEEYRRLGRGLLVVDRDDLLAAHTRHDREAAAERIATYFPADGVPRGDDYRGVLEQYDPRTQILVLIGRRLYFQILIIIVIFIIVAIIVFIVPLGIILIFRPAVFVIVFTSTLGLPLWLLLQ